MDNAERVAIFAMCAVSHLLEHIDTDEPADLFAARGVLRGVEVQRWIEDNAVMLPLRRDGKTLQETLS